MTARWSIISPLAGVLFWALGGQAQVPQLIRYQGRLTISGTNFVGIAQFKFALVNSNGTASFWSNNGTSSGGSEPTAWVPLPITGGVYSVLLGDTALPNNMPPIPPSVFTNSDVRLRIWFTDGSFSFQVLAPDQRLAPVAYAMMAATVPEGSITSGKIALGAVGTAQLADGAVTAGKVAQGAVGPSQFAGGNYVPSGGMILSSNYNDGYLFSAGYAKARLVQLSDGTFMYLYVKR